MTIETQMEELRSLAASAKMMHFLNFEFDPEMDMLYLIAASEGAFIRLGFYREQVEKIGKQLLEAARLMK